MKLGNVNWILIYDDFLSLVRGWGQCVTVADISSVINEQEKPGGKALGTFIDKTAPWAQNYRELEYILIDGVNDSLEHAKQLVEVLRGLSCKVNLIPFNPFDGCNYLRSQEKAIKDFKDYLIRKGMITTLRITRGDAIDGACGQLVGKLTKSIKAKNSSKNILFGSPETNKIGLEFIYFYVLFNFIKIYIWKSI